MRKTNTTDSANKVLSTKGIEGSANLGQYLSDNNQLLLPMLDLIEHARLSIDELISETSRLLIEALLDLSARQLAGEKQQGKRSSTSSIYWHGRQAGRVCLAERKIRVRKPRLRLRGEPSQEVEIPLYKALQSNQRLRERILEIMLCGVSTRKYETVLPKAAQSAGISKSSISRHYVYQSSEQLKKLLERPIDGDNILIVYIDGMVFGKHHLIAAIGVDKEGKKQVLGVTEGASENGTVVKDMLCDLQQRGLKANRKRLFVIDGSKALRSAIDQVYGTDNPVQRCRKHKVANVISYLPKHLRDQMSRAMKAAYRLSAKEGIARLKTQAEWLKREYPQAAASLLEGLAETFTINRLDLSTALQRSLATTNIIESHNSGVRRASGRVSRWENGEMLLRWAGAALLHVERHYVRMMGHRDLWMLEAILSAGANNGLANQEKVA